MNIWNFILQRQPIKIRCKVGLILWLDLQQKNGAFTKSNKIRMKAQLVYVQDLPILMEIKKTLKSKALFADNPWFQAYFDSLTHLKNTRQPLFAISISQSGDKNIRMVYSTLIEYKLTRQLCKCAHIQQLYTCFKVSKEQIEEFQKNLIQKLNCYKVVALNISENKTLQSNQRFMTIQNRANL